MTGQSGEVLTKSSSLCPLAIWLGSIETGKGVYVVIVDGTHVEISAKIEKVLIDGKLVAEYIK